MLTVTVIACRNLKNRELIGVSDPYVKVRMGNREASTTVKDGTLEPTYNEALQFSGAAEGTESLLISVMDKDKFSNDKIMGTCEVAAKTWKTAGSRTLWYSLVASNGRTSAGEVQLRFDVEGAGQVIPSGKFRPVWRFVGTWADRVALFTGRYDSTIEAGIDSVLSVATPAYDKVVALSGTEKMMYGGALAAALCAVSMVLALPALLLFPLTVLVIMFAGFFGGMLAPILLIAAFVIGCSAPGRTKLVNPTISKALSYDIGRRILLEE